jgi:hypothetical protein
MNAVKNSTACLTLLSWLLLEDLRTTASEPIARQRDNGRGSSAPWLPGPQDLPELHDLAHSHHVVMRAFSAMQQLAAENNDWLLTDWAAKELQQERIRISRALACLEPICESLAAAGDVIVIKSLDHWPDLGSDLDLFTNADPSDVVAIMKHSVEAKVAERSWGDRLANKWNFVVPGLPELVEIHVGRLGQTGEQLAITDSLITHSRPREFDGHTFQVASPENRLVISTLQRMYRHFYIRLCDIADNAQLIEDGVIDYAYLKSLARSAGLWDGLATYMAIISDYVSLYRGRGLELPSLVTSAARFGGDQVFFRRNFIRIPLVPHSANLYATELTRLFLNGEITNTLRLSLLPGLAAAAAIELKLTGSDKGIW